MATSPPRQQKTNYLTIFEDLHYYFFSINLTYIVQEVCLLWTKTAIMVLSPTYYLQDHNSVAENICLHRQIPMHGIFRGHVTTAGNEKVYLFLSFLANNKTSPDKTWKKMSLVHLKLQLQLHKNKMRIEPKKLLTECQKS